MKFSLTSEQQAFGAALDGLLGAGDVASAARDWGSGKPDTVFAIWARLAEIGATALRVPEQYDGLGGSMADVAVAFERFGFHGVPGPLVDTIVVAPKLLASGPAAELTGQISTGAARVSVGGLPWCPRAADAWGANHRFVVERDTLSEAEAGPALVSVDPTRTLHELTIGREIGPLDPATVARAGDEAVLATAAVLLGAGERLLHDSIEHVKVRRQFGRLIGEYQALKHALADVKVALDFARPLLLGAALSLDADGSTAARSVSAAKVACADAAYTASRTALQLHGAIGYTLEFDLSMWILRVRALVSAWGTTAEHRNRILDSLTAV